MQVAYVETAYKGFGLFETFASFSASSNNQVYADKCIGHHIAYALYFAGKQGCVVATAHQCQYRVRTALQRYMEMRHEAF